MPKVNTLCVMSEMPSVLFWRIIFTACGSQQSVVHAAAKLSKLSTHAAIIFPNSRVFEGCSQLHLSPEAAYRY
jgi:hypothetical protein